MVRTGYIKNKYHISLVAQMTKYSMGWSVTSLMPLMDPSKSTILQHNQGNQDFPKINYAFKRSTDKI